MEKLIKYLIWTYHIFPISIVTILSGFFLLSLNVFKNKSTIKFSKILFFYALVIVVFEIYTCILSAYSIYNHYVYLIFYIFEILLFGKFYYNLFENKRFKNCVIVVSILVVIAISINYFSNPNQLNEYTGIARSMGMIIFSLLFFYQMLNNLKVPNISESGLFFINTGVLIFFSGTFFVSLFIKEILDPINKELWNFYEIESFLIVFFRIMLCIGVWKGAKQIKKIELGTL